MLGCLSRCVYYYLFGSVCFIFCMIDIQEKLFVLYHYLYVLCMFYTRRKWWAPVGSVAYYYYYYYYEEEEEEEEAVAAEEETQLEE